MTKNIDDIQYFTYENMLTRFKRAKSEDTLDTMYKGAIKKSNNILQGNELFLAQIAIERALDRCQQDFDSLHISMTRKINHIVKKAEAPCKQYNPEDEMRRLLSNMN
ncbi:hypothetical protein [Aeromonas veronii]|uniref:hypothetical protein n=1 Tax=Aeromonas veronii TaxID=654 RepID=UPI000D113E23|nr:hypothetical protein [Aeromonas veronii]PSJ88732.1 hypothetical protein CT153_11410 [Aeromonas veronii]